MRSREMAQAQLAAPRATSIREVTRPTATVGRPAGQRHRIEPGLGLGDQPPLVVDVQRHPGPWSLLGRNGSGKTTTVKIMSTLIDASREPCGWTGTTSSAGPRTSARSSG